MKKLLVIILVMCCVKAAAQEFHLVLLNKKENKAALPEEEVKKLMDGHMANINRLSKEGKLWAAGPFDGGGGIFVFRTSSLDDVKSWMLTDPAVKAGRWNIEIFPYWPRIGSVCVVGEEYEMTHYAFIRYLQEQADVDKGHSEYLQSVFGNNIIAEGHLGEGSGSMLVLREEPTKEVLDQDPAVKNSSLTYTVKKLYIARGSFCEPK